MRWPWILAALLGLTLLAYSPVGHAGFVNLDDDAYVQFAPMVNRGIRPAAIVWAFTSQHSTNWHPATSLSHMLDCSLFGVQPVPMHWENVGWHLLNTLLVFAVWRRLTGAVGRSLVVAMLFALHPLHVESVAWISERKDVLSATGWLLGLWAYAAWVERRTWPRYAAVAACLLLALLAKPMAVTFPCTLLLLDFWPLRRWPATRWWPLIREKLPLLALVLAHSVVTYLVQSTTGAANYGTRFSIGERLGNAVVAYVRYLGKTIWPESLAPLYHHPGAWPAWMVAGSVLLLGGIAAVAWCQRRDRPWIAFGCLWFAGTLVPVIGLVQVGAQSMADRYTYIPLLGVFAIIAGGGTELWARGDRWRPALVAVCAALALGLAGLTFRQVGAWQNSETLYRHSIAVGEDDAGIRYLLAGALQAEHRPDADWLAQYRRAIELQPDYVNAHTQLAAYDAQHGRLAEARQRMELALRFEPRNGALHYNLGIVLLWLKQTGEARREFETAAALDPRVTGARRELAQLALAQNQWADARRLYAEIIRADPWNPTLLTEYGNLLANSGDLEGARRSLSRALWIDPSAAGATQSLAVVDQTLRQRSPR